MSAAVEYRKRGRQFIESEVHWCQGELARFGNGVLLGLKTSALVVSVQAAP